MNRMHEYWMKENKIIIYHTDTALVFAFDRKLEQREREKNRLWLCIFHGFSLGWMGAAYISYASPAPSVEYSSEIYYWCDQSSKRPKQMLTEAMDILDTLHIFSVYLHRILGLVKSLFSLKRILPLKWVYEFILKIEIWWVYRRTVCRHTHTHIFHHRNNQIGWCKHTQ